MQPNMKLYLDVSAQDFMVTRNPMAKVSDRRTGTQKVDPATNLPVWQTELTVLTETGASVIQVATVSAHAPAVSLGERVVPEVLEALPWSNKDRDGEIRMGIAFRAKELRRSRPGQRVAAPVAG